jgi:hypothetical protein
MNAFDPFALGGRQEGDEQSVALFREWMAVARQFGESIDVVVNDDPYYERMCELEDQIGGLPIY